MSAEPQPNAAAILDTLNDITRELEDGTKKRLLEPPVEAPAPQGSATGRAGEGVMPRVELERLTEPVPYKRSAARRVILGVSIALSYVAILAVAGLFISREVNPIAGPAHGASFADQARAVFASIVAKVDSLVHQRRGAAPDSVAAAPIERPAADTSPTVPAPRQDVVETESPPAAVAPLPVKETVAPASQPPDAAAQAPAAESSRAGAVASPPAPAALVMAPATAPAQPTIVSAPEVAPASPSVASAPAAAPSSATAVSAAAAAPTAAPVAAPAPGVVPPPATAVAPKPAQTAALPPAAAASKPAQTAALPPASSAEGQALRALGNDRLRQGDVASARLFYERAADAGDARAALLLGGTYDSAFLEQLGVRGMQGDVAQAAAWYRRAQALGEPEAEQRLRALPH